ncbi:hypothetical protein JQX30_08995 [Saccharopolyspora erythraea]|nr:hypothetical protein JQX30_08995 [Saccharopolyspora erythraea]
MSGRFRARKQPVISIDDPGLRVVVSAFDEAEAASSALGRSAQWRADEPAVLRHHLVVPEHEVATAQELLAPDGWTLRTGGEVAEQGEHFDAEGPGTVVALRVQVLDALHCSQESSRMAGLAQRLGGRALGWDALQPAPPEAG